MTFIHTSLAPTLSRRDAAEAARRLISPASYTSDKERSGLEVELRKTIGQETIVALDSGRRALQLALRVLGVGPGDDVLLQAYTCVSVPGPVRWVGARPVYVDIRSDTFTMDPDDLERKITPRAKALIIQHTFGLPADLDQLLAIAGRRGLVIIEDCAHALGATYHGASVGTFGDAAVFSFGRDKVISSVFGGALSWKSDVGSQISARFRLLTSDLRPPPFWWTAQQLFHPLATSIVKPTYGVGGKYLLVALQAAGLLSQALTPKEKRGGEPPLRPSLLPDGLAALARLQLTRLPEFIEHRQALAKHYTESLKDVPGIILPVPPDGSTWLTTGRTHGFLRYTIRVKDPAALHASAKRRGIILGDWYDSVVGPRGADLHAAGYTPGACPVAEAVARESVNLPTSPTLGIPEADRVLNLVRSCYT